MSGRTPNFSNWTRMEIQRLSREFRPIIFPKPGNSGVCQYIAGRRCKRRTIAGGLNACAWLLPVSISIGWIISSALSAPMKCRLPAKTAVNGQYQPGGGAAFFKAIREALGSLSFIADDLGDTTPEVVALLEQFQIPGTRVLQFEFGAELQNNSTPPSAASAGKPWFIPEPMITIPLRVGIRSCPAHNGKRCGKSWESATGKLSGP